jgi:membrane protein DedA with SNARE-associated domain
MAATMLASARSIARAGRHPGGTDPMDATTRRPDHDGATRSRSRRARFWLALGAAAAVAARYALSGVALLNAVPGSAGSLFFGQHAYAVVFLAAFVEGTALLGLLLPGAGVVAVSGAGARAVGLPLALLPLLVLAGAAGMLGGAVVNYHLGRLGLARLLREPWLGSWGPRTEARLADAASVLRRHGWWVTLLASSFSVGRSWLAVAAGAGGFPLRRLLLMQLPAALVWSALYAGGGYLLADQWDRLQEALRQAGVAGIAVALLAVGAWWAIRRRRRGQARARAAAAFAPAGPAQP